MDVGPTGNYISLVWMQKAIGVGAPGDGDPFLVWLARPRLRRRFHVPYDTHLHNLDTLWWSE